MLSNSKEILALFISLLLGVVSINCYAQTPIVSCPPTFSDGHGIHKLTEVMVYDGPVCMDVSLVPEYKKQRSMGSRYINGSISSLCV